MKALARIINLGALILFPIALCILLLIGLILIDRGMTQYDKSPDPPDGQSVGTPAPPAT
jgi:hypothetical protein